MGIAWLNGEDNWYDCMVCGEKFFSNEYHPRCAPYNTKMKMKGNKILMEFELNGLEYEATMIVNFCPQCGRELMEA